MEFKELTQKALELRKKYEELEKKTCGREWTNTELMAAFMADIGQLSKLIMAKEGLRQDFEATDEKLAHELADCFWCILILANKLNINLEKAFFDMTSEMNQRISQIK
jgi:NTP pyrophosphatase (non-canonical NTP hydrolase)